MEKEIKIEDLGWDEFFESDRKKLGLDSFEVARIIVQHHLGIFILKAAA